MEEFPAVFNNNATNNCPDGEYTSLDVCEAHNTNTVCGPSGNAGCFTRDFCKTGYYHDGTCEKGMVVKTDDLGCGYCVYTTKDQCLANSSGFDWDLKGLHLGIKNKTGTSLAVHWLRLHLPMPRCVGSTPG